MFLVPTIPPDIHKIIIALKNTNSSGYDDIVTNVIKNVAFEISSVLSYIINLCIDNGKFPEDLKLAIIKPIHKKDDPKNMKNYRPIALVPVFSKIIEKVIYNSLYSFLEKNEILTKEQYGFRRNKNINMAIYELIKDIISNMDKKIPVTALFMDMTKAFDFVDHRILLTKLNKLGIRGNVLELLESYLTNRRQVTKITKVCPKTKTELSYISKQRFIYYGVPQGSVLGPLLFLCYINDIPRTIEHPMTLFADDCTTIFIGKKLETYENQINNSLSIIIHWLKCNNLKINFEKTHIINFNQRKKSINPIIKYEQNTISKIDNTKFLGLWLDQQMTWKTHIDHVIKKLNQYCYALHNLSKVANHSTVLTAYHAYVSTTLRYGVIFWGNSTDREMAFKAQKKCLRAVCMIRNTESCKPLFTNLKILTLPSLYIYEVTMFIKNNHNQFETVSSKRHQDTLKSKSHQTTLYSKSFLGMAPKIFNKLPKSIRCSRELNTFKNKLQKFLIEKAYYNINEYLEDNL